MKPRSRKAVIIVLITMIITIGAFAAYAFVPVLTADKSWISDLGYEQIEIHNLTFSRFGYRGCPNVPVEINDQEYILGFDTGCGVGLSLTNAVENELEYTLIGKTEELNRDGSHRGWSKHVLIDGITVFGRDFKGVETSIADWSMFSSKKFNGLIGLSYFQSKIITLDYRGHRIAVSENPIDYGRLPSGKYAVLPLRKTTSRGQENLPFFEAELDGRPIIVYMDTGKNHSYIYNPGSKYSIADKRAEITEVALNIGGIEVALKGVAEVSDIDQADGLPYPTMIELNSDQIWKAGLLVTFDLIEQKIILRKQ